MTIVTVPVNFRNAPITENWKILCDVVRHHENLLLLHMLNLGTRIGEFICLTYDIQNDMIQLVFSNIILNVPKGRLRETNMELPVHFSHNLHPLHRIGRPFNTMPELFFQHLRVVCDYLNTIEIEGIERASNLTQVDFVNKEVSTMEEDKKSPETQPVLNETPVVTPQPTSVPLTGFLKEDEHAALASFIQLTKLADPTRGTLAQRAAKTFILPYLTRLLSKTPSNDYVNVVYRPTERGYKFFAYQLNLQQAKINVHVDTAFHVKVITQNSPNECEKDFEETLQDVSNHTLIEFLRLSGAKGLFQIPGRAEPSSPIDPKPVQEEASVPKETASDSNAAPSTSPTIALPDPALRSFAGLAKAIEALTGEKVTPEEVPQETGEVFYRRFLYFLHSLAGKKKVSLCYPTRAQWDAIVEQAKTAKDDDDFEKALTSLIDTVQFVTTSEEMKTLETKASETHPTYFAQMKDWYLHHDADHAGGFYHFLATKVFTPTIEPLDRKLAEEVLYMARVYSDLM